MLRSGVLCVGMLTVQSAMAVTPLDVRAGAPEALPPRLVECRIVFDSPGSTAAALDNCAAGWEPQTVAAVSVIVRARVVKRLAPAVKRGEERKSVLVEEIARRFPGAVVTAALETRGDVSDSAIISLTPRATEDDKYQGRAALARVVALENSVATTVDSPARPVERLHIKMLGLAGRGTYAGHAFRFTGASAIWAPPFTSILRSEVGLRGGSLAADEHKDLYVGHLHLGLAANAGPAVFSLRGLGGLLALKGGGSVSDLGGELALALELGPAVVATSYARTTGVTGLLFGIGVQL